MAGRTPASTSSTEKLVLPRSGVNDERASDAPSATLSNAAVRTARRTAGVRNGALALPDGTNCDVASVSAADGMDSEGGIGRALKSDEDDTAGAS